MRLELGIRTALMLFPCLSLILGRSVVLFPGLCPLKDVQFSPVLFSSVARDYQRCDSVQIDGNLSLKGLADQMPLSYLGKFLFCLNSVESYLQVSTNFKNLDQASDIRSVTILGP